MSIGDKLYKNNAEDMAKYTTTAIWCNSNNAHIEDKGEYYEVCENIVPEPTVEEKLAELDSQYNAEITRLGNEYNTAQLRGDTDMQSALKEEMASLDEWFDEEYKRIVGGAE